MQQLAYTYLGFQGTMYLYMAVGGLATLIIFALLWRKSKIIALLMLSAVIGFVLYKTVEWESVRQYFFVGWGPIIK